MKKILIAVLFISSVCFAQHPALDLYSIRLAAGRGFITSEEIYDSYDLFKSPLGVFQIDSSSLSLEIGYSLLSLDNERGHYVSIPILRMGEPGRAYFQISYGPDLLYYDTPDGNTVSLPLHRFGLTLAAQSESGTFQASIMGTGYIGTQSWEEGYDQRSVMGLENLRFDFGSQVHPLARIGVFIGAGLHLDTLNSADNERNDRSAHVVLPAFGGFVNFGGQYFPARSHLSLQYAPVRFVYVSKDGQNDAGVDDRGMGNEYSIMTDSLQVLWMTVGRVPLGEHFAKPALLLGTSVNAGQLHMPNKDSDPFRMETAVPGGHFNLTEMYLGTGLGFEVINYAELFIEYVYTWASLNYGGHFPDDSPKERGLYTFAAGVSTPMHKYVSMPFSLNPRIAYFMSESAGEVKPRRMNINPLNPVDSKGKSKAYRYEPQTYLKNKETLSGITVGLDAWTPDTKFGGSLYTTFINKNQGEHSGIEMGFVFAISLPGPSSGLFE